MRELYRQSKNMSPKTPVTLEKIVAVTQLIKEIKLQRTRYEKSQYFVKSSKKVYGIVSSYGSENKHRSEVYIEKDNYKILLQVAILKFQANITKEKHSYFKLKEKKIER